MPPLPPVPVQVLAIPAASARAHRPGLIGLIGVCSILVGVLSLLANAGLSFQALIVHRFATRMAVMTAPPPTQLAEDAVPDAPTNGMTPAERTIVIEGLGEVRTISPARREQLDALLAETGHTIFYLRGPALTPRSVHANVSDSSRFPAVGGREGPDVFVIGQGRIEIYDDHAVFFPSVGGEPVRVAGGQISDASGNRILAAAVVQAVVAHVQQLASHRLNSAQTAAFSAALSAPGQQLITPTSSPAGAAAQIRYAAALPDGAMQIAFTNSGITLTPGGQITPWGATGPPPTGALPALRINGPAVALAIGSSLLAGALSLYLIVAGSLVLRQSPSGRMHHRIYAYIKLPLEIASAFVWAWLWSSYVSTQSSGSAPPALNGATLAATIVGIVGCLYPVIVLLAFRSKSLRDYYATVWQ
jgi:hypothetical protein